MNMRQLLQSLTLENENLDRLHANIITPKYNRGDLTAGIVHIGLGNFHRAHQAWYLHQLMQQNLALDWAIVGAGVRAFDQEQRSKLAAQDYLTTLIELDPSSTRVEIIGSMIDYVAIEDDNAALIQRMSSDDIRIVSLTVTEGGYYIDPVTKAFLAEDPDILHDADNPSKPKTAFGAICAALQIRRESSGKPFTVQSCDNLQGNGDILRNTLVSLARLSDPSLADWIERNCSFPNSMVDCIVPSTGETERALVRELGIDDAVPVTHENFRQWVIEDNFCAGRPSWEKVGVTFTDSVHDYEAMKIRILNGGHQLLANAGEVLGINTISECMANPAVSAFFTKTALTEIVPHVKAVPDMQPDVYVELIKTRFANPKIVDTTRRVAFDGTSRHPGFVIPSIFEGIAANTAVSGLILAEAIWARMCEGSREDGSQIEANDPNWQELQLVASAAKKEPALWLAQQQYYADLASNSEVVEEFSKWLRLIWSEGVNVALTQYVKG
jgi:mannitol 2-dehydrogenase